MVQIGEDWGTVHRINIRTTIVQTFDNASLIIPNSEMLANKVTNWSYKDPKVRRQVDIGVAYGSDVQLVRKILPHGIPLLMALPCIPISLQVISQKRRYKSNSNFLQ